MLVGATAYRMLARGSRTTCRGRRRPDLGRLRRPRLDGHPDRQGLRRHPGRRRLRSAASTARSSAHAATSTAATSTTGACSRTGRTTRYGTWLKGARAFGKAIWDVLGDTPQPAHRLRAPGRGHDPDLHLRLRQRRHGGHLRRHHRLPRDRRSALSVDATEAPAGLALRQRRPVRRVQPMVASGEVDPCLSQTFEFDEVGLAHQLMYENKHPMGNMSILVGARDADQRD